MADVSNASAEEGLTHSVNALKGGSLRDLAATVGHRLESLGLGRVREDSVIYAVAVTFACGLLLLTWAVTRWAFARRDRRDCVVLVGTSGEGEAPGAGKTVLYKVLKTGRVPKYGVVSSVEPRECMVEVRSRLRVRLVDFPGAVILRAKLARYLKKAKGVVFIVDAVAFPRKSRKDATLLYKVLTYEGVIRRRTPVLVFCNKSEIVGAASVEAVKSGLEEELGKLRMPSEHAIGDIGGTDLDDDSKPFLGIEGEEFKFDHLDTPVSFAAGSALRLEVAPVTGFIAKVFSS